jgi:mRNA interferase RelE/StbE
MEIRLLRKFVKELAKIPSPRRLQIEAVTKDCFSNPDLIFQAEKLEKLKGFQNYYKIRFGDYRIGIRLENEICYFERVIHRKDIYNVYP